MNEDRQRMIEQDPSIIRLKLSLIRYFGFNLKPFSLGVAVRFINERKFWDEYYLQMNELELYWFLVYVLDYNLIGGRMLMEKQPYLYNMANEILWRETSEAINNMDDWKSFLCALYYIDAKKEETLIDLPTQHPRGGEILHFLKFVVAKDPNSKDYLKHHNFTSLAFADTIAHRSKRALKHLTISFRG